MLDEKNKVLKLLRIYSAKIKENPADSINFVFRSACYEYLNEHRHALRDALLTIRRDPEYWKGHHQAMKMHIKIGHIEEAEKIAEMFKENEAFRKISLELNRLKEIDQNVWQAKNEKTFNRELKKVKEIAPSCRKYQHLTYERSKKILTRSNSAPKLSTNKQLNDLREIEPKDRRRTNSNGFVDKKKQSKLAGDESLANRNSKCSIS